MQNLNKKGIIGAGLATIFAIMIIALILAVFFMSTAAFGFFGFGDGVGAKVLEGKPLKDSSILALLKTPFTLQVGEEKVNSTLSEMLVLYSYDILSGEIVKEKVKEAFTKSYGNCYNFKFEVNNGKTLEYNWQPTTSERKNIETITNLPTGRFSFRNDYAECQMENGKEYCDVFCGVER